MPDGAAPNARDMPVPKDGAPEKPEASANSRPGLRCVNWSILPRMPGSPGPGAPAPGAEVGEVLAWAETSVSAPAATGDGTGAGPAAGMTGRGCGMGTWEGAIGGAPDGPAP